MIFEQLSKQLDGELFWDDLHKKMYATDASVYQIEPLAVAYPKHKEDIQSLVIFANKQAISLIPRAAGTSLAGQCVGKGIVVDVSKHLTKIIQVNEASKTVRVQPGVIRDELNAYLALYGLFFGPNTSTSNRCMIGGMVGNNSSGTTSIQYGVTRDKVLELECILSDASCATFGAIDSRSFREKRNLQTQEGSIYRTIHEVLQPKKNREEIVAHFPKPEIHRRNTGYALDVILQQEPYTKEGDALNLCALLTGSEGTLAFTTEITLQLDQLPPPEKVVVAAHFASIEHCMKAVTGVMKHNLYTCEMMDKVILDCTSNNHAYEPYRFFIEGDPAAILLLELRDETQEQLNQQLEVLLKTLKEDKLAYDYPVLEGDEIDKALELRKAGLGLLGNMIGDSKAVACIEDTAVALENLDAYINDFTTLMKRHNQEAVYYAHAGAGELHLRPILNLKKSEDVTLFKAITKEVALLVKSYGGSLSGEHGDGIVRSSLLPVMIGSKNYKLLKQLKEAFDPDGIFNPGKIIESLPIAENLRYQPDRVEPKFNTFLDFDKEQGILRLAEQCNGSGDCRKTATSSGMMCPSYRATLNEKDSTRARANALRSVLTQSTTPNAFSNESLKEVFDLCLSCKACASECPSNVDVATLKAEFEFQYSKSNKPSFSSWSFAHSTRLNKMASYSPKLTNFLFTNKLSSKLIKKGLDIHPKRSLPEIKPYRLAISKQEELQDKSVVLYIDEFTQFLDGQLAEDAYFILDKLGYNISVVSGLNSGRALISKGFLEQAKKSADRAIKKLSPFIKMNIPILGIEPSAILGFRDEFLRLATNKEAAEQLAKFSFLLEEFLDYEREKGIIRSEQFTSQNLALKIHNHCHQKALSNTSHTFNLLNLPENYKPTIIPSGCCGMAGSFGYESKNYKLSMQIGEQSLFKPVRKAPTETIIVANGTSCRHQIKDGTGKKALHPITVLKNALKV